MSDAAAKRKVGSIEIPEALVRRAPARQASVVVQAVEAPTNNPVFKIIFSENTTPEQKRSELAKYLTFTGSKEESKERIRAYQEFEEYLQSERERMSREIIRLTDTETFSELQASYNDLNNALLDFDEKMKPLTDIIEAIYVLRTNDKTMDAFREIQLDRKKELIQKENEAQKTLQFDDIKERISRLTIDVARLGEEKSFFGFGGIKENARKQIAENEQQIKQAESELQRLSDEISSTTQSNGESSLGEFVKQKDKLRELLDISSDEHRKRQRELVDTALAFVEKAKTRIGSVREHLGNMTDQIDALYDANTKMTGVYAVMSEGIKESETDNRASRQVLQTPNGEESLIAKMGREEKLAAIEDHIRALDSASGSTIETFADLTSQTIRIRTMRDSNENQIDKARRMHNQGVAGVADRLSVVLNAVSAAALGESSAMAKDTLAGMTDRTNKVAQKEVIQQALGVRELNRDVEKAISDLGDFGEVLRTSTEIYREGLTEVHANIDRMRQLAEEVRGDIKESSAVHADTTGQTTSKEPVVSKPASPFDFSKGR